MLRVAICEDVYLSCRSKHRSYNPSWQGYPKNVKFFLLPEWGRIINGNRHHGKYGHRFLDVEMLGISGIETARILRERDSRVILIFVSLS